MLGESKKFDYNKFRTFIGKILILIFLIFVRGKFNYYGLILFTGGCLIRIWASGYIHKDKEVTKSGPYKFLRHPLYLGSFIAGLGFVLFLNVGWAIILYIPFFFIIYYKKMKMEEQFLLNKFGEQYKSYQEHTPFFIPKLTNIKLKDNIEFSWQGVIRNKELLNLLSGVVIIIIFVFFQGILVALLKKRF